MCHIKYEELNKVVLDKYIVNAGDHRHRFLNHHVYSVAYFSTLIQKALSESLMFLRR